MTHQRPVKGLPCIRSLTVKLITFPDKQITLHFFSLPIIHIRTQQSIQRPRFITQPHRLFDAVQTRLSTIRFRRQKGLCPLQQHLRLMVAAHQSDHQQQEQNLKSYVTNFSHCATKVVQTEHNTK